MSKRKHSVEWMLERVREYLEGKGSYKTIATANGISETTLKGWVKKYGEAGEEGLEDRRGYHKTDEEVDELERLRRENMRLMKLNTQQMEQSMSRVGHCIDNCPTEGFWGIVKAEY